MTANPEAAKTTAPACPVINMLAVAPKPSGFIAYPPQKTGASMPLQTCSNFPTWQLVFWPSDEGEQTKLGQKLTIC